jgi:hypothetical protein
MDYGINYILVKSNWFDPQLKKTRMKEIGADGLLIYLTLFKFKLFNYDKNSNEFSTSVSLINKEIPTEYKFTKKRVYELIRHLIRKKVIKVTNVSNWSNQMTKINLIVNEDGKEEIVKETDYDKILIIEAVDYPVTKSEKVDGKWIDKPVSDEDYYIAVHSSMISRYLENGLDERYIVLLILFQKYNRSMSGFYMKMEKIQHVTGIDKNTINRMTWKMFEMKILVAYRKSNKKGKYYNEYHIYSRDDEVIYENFISVHGEELKRWKNRLDKKRKRQKLKTENKEKKKASKVVNNMAASEVDIESQIDTQNDIPDEDGLWGEDLDYMFE